MEMRKCGHHGLELPVLGMGAWSYGGGDYWGPQDQKDVDTVVRCAIDHGCNFFDTAEAYNSGTSETSLGAALRGIPRDQVLIGTKISPSNTEPRKLLAHCEASLRRLQTDYVDLYMVHWPITPHAIRHFTAQPIPTPSVTDAFETLMRLQAEGKIRHIGVSNFGREKIDEALATGAKIVINELPYSLLTRAIELEILPHCRTHGIGVLGYMSLMQGVLADKFRTIADIPVSRRRTRHFDSRRNPQCRHGMPGVEAELTEALQAIRSIATREHLTVSELALKWAFGGDGITSSLCGSRTIEQFQANYHAASEPLLPDVRRELNAVTDPLLAKLGPSFDYYEHPDNDRTR
ncbi:MAG TPA: aldo/keto reductase [Verrucomicrobiae bacterium]|nr:aldo/keto reductase [Verrucomicrobiae bacterium]